MQAGTFVLAGRSWEITHIEWERGVCVVRPAPQGRPARWSGRPRFLSYELCQSMRALLISDDIDPSWSQRAQRVLATSRSEHAFLREHDAPFVDMPEEITWHTFAGGAANLLLARMVTSELGGEHVARNTSLTLRGESAKSLAAVRHYLRGLARDGRPNGADARAHAASPRRSRVSKFEPALPEGLLAELVAASTLDHAGARRVAEQVR